MPKPPFLIDEIARYPQPGFVAPDKFAFSPDDSMLTFLHSTDHTLTRQLFAFDPRTGERQNLLAGGAALTEENINREEALRRERQRQYETGVTQYEWAAHGQRILVPFPDGLYIQEGMGAELRKVLPAGKSPVIDARFSPDGKWIAYVQEGELAVLPSEGGDSRRLTSGASPSGKTNGLAEYIAQEEMGRFQGYWWSPDSRFIAFEEVDESQIPIYTIVHQGSHETGPAAREDHRYPFAGQANAQVRLGVVALEGGDPLWMQLGEFEYLARVDWLADGSLCAQLLDREQRELRLVCCDLHTGAARTLLVETSPAWINLHDMFRPLPVEQKDVPNGFIWASERSGYQHLYLYQRDGSLVRALTSGEWMVTGIAGVDAKGGSVYFTGWMESALETHLYEVSLDGSAPRRITREPGTHLVWLDHRFKTFVDLHHSFSQPPHASLRRLSSGAQLREIYQNDDPRLRQFRLSPPELVSIQNHSGVTLHGALFRPRGRAVKPGPAIVFVYGGPHAQMVSNSWNMTAAMRLQYLRGLGYAVFVLDNRGSANRGVAFESAIRWRFGGLEVEDQVDGVHWLVEQKIAEPERVAVMGWSYGGYMAAMCLARAPEIFKVAVSGAPVTSWDGYDTCYTERYMGTPQANPQGYEESSVLKHVASMRGKLLLVHGLIDENVHFRHTARLVTALIQARKPYELLLFPDERHGPRRQADRVYMEERIIEFLSKNL